MRILTQRLLRIICLGTTLGLCTACALTSKPAEKVSITAPNEEWWSQAGQSQDQATKNLAQVRTRMNKVTEFQYILALSSQTEINAYATQQNQQTLVVFTKGFIDQFGNDPDVLATTLGHEIAHHQLGHIDADRQNARTLAQEITSTVLGSVASFFIPFSGFIVGPSVKAATLSFNRDDERDADAKGMQWAMQAGYSPCGSYRLSKSLTELGKDNSLPFLTTHPGNGERSENAQSFMKENKLPACN